jgi:ectoine hydroxylase-related dioxygenase (phytanoyl-CoA dioxygenase family)
MKTRVSHQQIEHYRDNGFVVIRNFLTPEELEEWRSAVDEAVGARGQGRLPGGGEPAQKIEDYYNNVFIQSLNLWQSSERIKRIMLDERLGKIAADLAGVDGIRIWHDQALIKRPWDNPTSWHLDNPYWSFTNRAAISLWVALDDATLENGCLWFLPGTHKLARDENPGIGPNMNHVFKMYPEWATIDSVASPMKAGDASFHNGWVAHAAGPNMTRGWRRAMTCGYMPDGSTFNGKQNILSKEMFESLKIGDVLDNDAQNPLIYSRAAKRSRPRPRPRKSVAAG